MKKNFITNLFVIVIAIFALTLVGCSNAGKAEDGVKEYVAKLYPGWTVEGTNVMDYDSDGDGYVSADVRIKNSTTGEEKTLSLNCAKVGSFNSGCKAKVPVVGTGN